MSGKLKAFPWAIAGTTFAVIAIAVFAGIQSFSHIYQIARTHGQDKLDAALMPFSVDGLIVAAALVMLHFSRAVRPAPWLARFALWLGIGVTVAANVGAGLPWGVIGALVSVWAAVSFVTGVELLMVFIRKAKAGGDTLTVRDQVKAQAQILGVGERTAWRYRATGTMDKKLAEKAMVAVNGNGKH